VLDFKHTSHSIKNVDEPKGIVEAYANVYNNADSDEDVSLPGSFDKTVVENFKRIRVLRNHWSTERLGVPKELDSKDTYGLRTITQFNMNKSISKDMFFDNKMAMENGQNAELSIGYEVIDSYMGKHDGEDVRFIRQYKLYEYSFLDSWAANPLAIVSGQKDAKSTQTFITWLTKAYNLPYSDGRLVQIETLLKSLTVGPGQDTTPPVEPIIIDPYKSLFKIFN
jgi:HK97 family phage prohead protease